MFKHIADAYAEDRRRREARQRFEEQRQREMDDRVEQFYGVRPERSTLWL